MRDAYELRGEPRAGGLSMVARRQGIAVVTALLVLVAVFVVGAGAAFLAQMNLGVAVNVRSNAIAQANAETGVDAVVLALEHAFLANDAFPNQVPSPTVTGVNYVPTYTLGPASEVLDDERALVQVIGTGPNNAEHVAEAVIAMAPGVPRLPPAWEFGLASEATCRTTGTSTFLNAGVHCNAGFDLGSNDEYGICDERDADGRCIASTPIPVADAPVSASPGATLCSPDDLCEDGLPKTLIEPITISPGFEEKMWDAIERSNVAPDPEGVYSGVFGIFCDEVFSSASQFTMAALQPGTTVCVESGDLAIPRDSNLESVSMITQGSITVGRDTIIQDSIIASVGGRLESASNGNASVTVIDSELYSNDSLRINGQQSSFSGITTVASGSDVTINGGSPAAVSPEGEIGIGLTVIAEANVVVNGESDWFVSVLAGGSFTQNGNSTLYGNVAGVGALRFNGGIDIDSGLPILNEIGSVEGDPFARVVTRR